MAFNVFTGELDKTGVSLSTGDTRYVMQSGGQITADLLKTFSVTGVGDVTDQAPLFIRPDQNVDSNSFEVIHFGNDNSNNHAGTPFAISWFSTGGGYLSLEDGGGNPIRFKALFSASDINAGVLGYQNGGTSLSAIPTANYLLGVAAGGSVYEGKNLIGETNQITVAHTAGQIKLTTPQSIATTSDVTFNKIVLGTSTTAAVNVTNSATGFNVIGDFYGSDTSGTSGATRVQVRNQNSGLVINAYTSASVGVGGFLQNGMGFFSTTTTAKLIIGHVGTSAGQDVAIFTNNLYYQPFLYITQSQKMGVFNVLSPTAYIHIAAGTTAATTAPLKFTSGTANTTAEAGAMEYDNSLLFTQSDATRRYVVQAASATKTTAAAPYTNDGYITIRIGGTDVKVMTTA